MPDEKTWIELAKINADSHKTRQGLEWKILLAFWAGVAITVWFLYDQQVALSLIERWLWVGAYVVAFIATVFCAIQPLHQAHKTDRQWQHYYMAKAMGESPEKPSKVCGCHAFTRSWAWGQIIITAALLFVASLLVIAQPDHQKQAIWCPHTSSSFTREAQPASPPSLAPL